MSDFKLKKHSCDEKRFKFLSEFRALQCPLKNHSHCQKRPRNLKGPLRVVRLCVLGIILPSILIAVPLYMRYHVYNHQLYPLAVSDMRLLDNKVSTTWCQRQLVKVNTTFNAFLLENTPSLSSHLKPLSMVRHLHLEDDTKEYWGFYLLQGTSVTVSTCVRWPGASLIVIRGHKHLHECAYIGDNSSEELDELMESLREKSIQDQKQHNESETRVNQPDKMKRHRVDVEFHHPIHKNNVQNYTIDHEIDISDSDTDPKALKPLLDSLQSKKQKQKEKDAISDVHMHVHRNSTIAEGESKNFKIEPPHSDRTKSQETYDDIIKQLERLGNKTGSILEQLNKRFGSNAITKNRDNSLNQPNQLNQPSVDMKGRQYSKPSVNFDDNIDRARRKREIIISNAMRSNFSEDDEENDLAVEEGFSPDGIADHRGTFNETTLNDYSNSEFWSSFSSSEEALLNCAGLILNLPLTPHHKCGPELTEEQAEETYLANTITYKVPVNGYYFFVFNSENEVQPNYIRVQFHLKKTIYNVSNAVSTCVNTSEACALDLKFFSSEKVVMELPMKDDSSHWNEEFIVVSECEPRTAIYAICVIAVPVLVILFAFS